MEKSNSEKYIELSDEKLVILVRESDDLAFKILYERYLPKIRTMTYSFQGLGYDIDDLVSLTAPKKLLLVSAEEDKYSMDAREIAEKAGLIDRWTKAISPFVSFMFPDIPKYTKFPTKRQEES